MNRYATTILLTLVPLAFGACSTPRLTVSKVQGSPEPKGIRYSLPKPFLLVTPNPSGDGSLTVEVIYLPDESNTYAIDGSTRRGKYELTVNVKDGLLSKIVWSQKDAELLAQSISAGGDLVKAELDRKSAEKKEKDDKNDAA